MNCKNSLSIGQIVTRLSISIVLISTLGWPAYVAAQDSPETAMLKARTAEFDQEIIQVSNNVFTAVGYAVSPVSMIVGSEGLVIVDTGIDLSAAQQIREDFRAISDKPVQAIIFTHGHGDHTTGASAFMDSADVQVWARQDYGHEGRFLQDAGLTVQNQRGARQGGFLLTPEQRINNGVAKAYWPTRGGEVFNAAEAVVPNHFLEGDRLSLNIAGLELELVAASGETNDQLYIWYPQDEVAFAGDNFYKSWPNLYAIRGTGYRDIREWALSLGKILDENPAALVGGHTRPIIGREQVQETLTNFRDAIQFVFDKTIEGMNQGMTPDQLVQYVQLPEKYQELDYLKPYYGNPEWAVRSIFNGYLGWFDGNATTLFSLSEKDEAQRIADLAGGAETLRTQAIVAQERGDNQWAAQLCDYLLALDPEDNIALLTKADALEGLADKLLTATGRNYYLTSAVELRRRAND